MSNRFNSHQTLWISFPIVISICQLKSCCGVYNFWINPVIYLFIPLKELLFLYPHECLKYASIRINCDEHQVCTCSFATYGSDLNKLVNKILYLHERNQQLMVSTSFEKERTRRKGWQMSFPCSMHMDRCKDTKHLRFSWWLWKNLFPSINHILHPSRNSIHRHIHQTPCVSTTTAQNRHEHAGR